MQGQIPFLNEPNHSSTRCNPCFLINSAELIEELCNFAASDRNGVPRSLMHLRLGALHFTPDLAILMLYSA